MKLPLFPRILVYYICIILAMIPFFWLKPGEMDLGGDSSRLYFYDPLSYLVNSGLFTLLPEGIGKAQPNHYFIPFVGLLALLKYFIPSSYLLITLFNSFKLVVSFLSVYLIVDELLKVYKNKLVNFEYAKTSAALLAGLLYVFMPTMTGNWDKALLTQNQIFLNPVIFYLLLRYFLTYNTRYVWGALLTTFIFAPNFAWNAAPPFFSFYPLSISFLIIYVLLLRKRKLPVKGIFIGIFFFLGLHVFHLVPQTLNLLDPGSYINKRIFENQGVVNEGVRYFNAILPLSRLNEKIVIASSIELLRILSILFPALLLFGLLVNKKKDKTILVTALFFLITLFLLTAKITNIGTKIYEHFFYLPGSSMFRNFLGQWLFVYSFFYALFFGQALFWIFSLFKIRPILVSSGILAFIITVQAFPFINGSLVNHQLQASKRYIAIKMDPQYEETLEYIKKIPDDGKILTLPFTDYYYQTIAGINNGAYQGPSTLAYLAGKKDFAGYGTMDTFPEVFFRLSREKKYESIERLLALLNIRYIFHNTGKNVYDDTFPVYPYQYARQSLPQTQKEYENFVNRLVEKKIYENGPYKIFATKIGTYLPHMYIADSLHVYDYEGTDWEGRNMSFFENTKNSFALPIYIESKTCRTIEKGIACKNQMLADNKQLPSILFKKISPTKYKVTITNAKNPFFLVFSEAYNANWKVFISSEHPILEESVVGYRNNIIKEGRHENIFINKKIFETNKLRQLNNKNHVLANGYANSWYIRSEDVNNKENYELIVEMTDQKVFYISLASSVFFLIILFFWGMKLFFVGQSSWYNKEHT